MSALLDKNKLVLNKNSEILNKRPDFTHCLLQINIGRGRSEVERRYASVICEYMTDRLFNTFEIMICLLYELYICR